MFWVLREKQNVCAYRIERAKQIIPSALAQKVVSKTKEWGMNSKK